ncbi:hypothetical protein [Pseudomonas sp.]|uniref:hypothetical protein n=1 Tax=Pseudomonas sp. TaxID=306 RepID=UPI0029AB53A7|nr:hypothetical protein [Pseudomonas sp.]MDX3740895.1 hypothetical protein [Pseudomonas sp.]
MPPKDLSQPSIMTVLSKPDLNEYWDRHASRKRNTLSEKIIYDEEAGFGIYKFGALDLGTAFMRFGEDLLLVVQRVLRYMGFRTRIRSGTITQRIYEINQAWYSDADVVVMMTLSAPLKYTIDNEGSLTLRLPAGATIHHNGSGYPKEMVDDLIQERGIKLPSAVPPTGILLGDTIGQFTDGDPLMLFQVPAPSTPLSPDTLSVNGERLTGPVGFGIIYQDTAFPELKQGHPPRDRDTAVSLFAPKEMIDFMNGAYYPASGAYSAEFALNSAFEATDSASEPAVPASIYPLLKEVYAGAEKQALTLEPATPNSQFTFDGEALGELKQESGSWFYYPPAPLDPAVILEVNNKTNVPAALSATVPEYPLVADVIKAQVGSQYATSTFLTPLFGETHFFKASLSSGKVKLTLFYSSFEHDEPIEVSAENTQWVRITGNGNIDKSGVFTPAADQPSPFTVWLARDIEDDHYYYWASVVLPLPILEPAKVLQLING